MWTHSRLGDYVVVKRRFPYRTSRPGFILAQIEYANHDGVTKLHEELAQAAGQQHGDNHEGYLIIHPDVPETELFLWFSDCVLYVCLGYVKTNPS